MAGAQAFRAARLRGPEAGSIVCGHAAERFPFRAGAADPTGDTRSGQFHHRADAAFGTGALALLLRGLLIDGRSLQRSRDRGGKEGGGSNRASLDDTTTN